jgi:hypothetical protein
VTGQQTIVPITVVVVKSQPTAQIQRPNHIYAAAFLGIPILALMGCFGRKNSPRKNFFRYLGLILLLVGVSYTTGCGRGFTWPPPQGNQGGLDPGDYLIQVTATDQTGTQKYYAALQLHVPTE